MADETPISDPSVCEIPIDKIVGPRPQLRDVRKNTPEFLELMTQIKEHGHTLNSICVRPLYDGTYQVCDGNYRYEATKAAGLGTMFCVVRPMDDEEYLTNQIRTNAGRVDTDLVDYATHLNRLRKMVDTEMTIAELAAVVEKSTKWVAKVLRLNDLIPKAKAAYKRGEITASNAQALAKLPRFEQPKYFEDALALPSAKFQPIITRAVSDFREAVRGGKLDALGMDDMAPRMRSMKDIVAELDSPSCIPMILAAHKVKNPVDIAMMALKWAFRLDPDSVDERKQKLINEDAQRLEDAKRRWEEREELKIKSS